MATGKRSTPSWVWVAATLFALLVFLSWLTTAHRGSGIVFPRGRWTLRVQDPEGNPIARAEVVQDPAGVANPSAAYFNEYTNDAVPKSTNDGVVTLSRSMGILGGGYSWRLLWIWRIGSEPPRPIVIALRVSAPGYEPAWVSTDALFRSHGPLPVVLQSQIRPGGKIQAAPASAIVAAARGQIGKTKIYDGSYVGLDYPGGDVPIERGVCTDVVVRALRDSVKMDLQELVHEDMKAAFRDYPTIWGLKKPDRNIDHRRVPNLRRYFERKGYSIGVTERKEDYRPGDVVTCTVPPNRPHMMIVSDRRAKDGIPLVIHNIGRGTKEEKRLFEFPLTGHYRIK